VTLIRASLSALKTALVLSRGTNRLVVHFWPELTKPRRKARSWIDLGFMHPRLHESINFAESEMIAK